MNLSRLCRLLIWLRISTAPDCMEANRMAKNLERESQGSLRGSPEIYAALAVAAGMVLIAWLMGWL